MYILQKQEGKVKEKQGNKGRQVTQEKRRSFVQKGNAIFGILW